MSLSAWRIDISGFNLLFLGYFCFFQVLILFLFSVFRRDNIKALKFGIILLQSRELVPSQIRSLAMHIKRFKFIDKVIYYSVIASMVLSWFVLLYSLELSLEQLNLPKTQRSPTIMPVVPGITVPLSALVALVAILLIHEFSHGILAERYGVRVKSFGIIYFLCLPIGAYVELDDREIENLPRIQQINIFGVASLANLISGILALLLLRELIVLGLVSPRNLLAEGWAAVIFWFAVLSFSIGVVNFLPVPGLDGYKIMSVLEKTSKSRFAKWIIRNAANLLVTIFLVTLAINVLLIA